MDNDLTLKAAALQLGFVSETEFDRIVDPEKMVNPYCSNRSLRGSFPRRPGGPADGMTAITVILAMSLGLIGPKVVIDSLGDGATGS